MAHSLDQLQKHDKQLPHVDSQDDDSNDELDAKPSVLSIMVENHASIEQTVTLLKKEIVSQTPEIVNPEEKVPVVAPVKKEFESLNNLLSDNQVQTIIKSVAGFDTKQVIDQAMSSINSSQSIEAKRKAFSLGIRQLQSSLATKLKDNHDIRNDPTFNLALSLTGINRKSLYER